MKSDLMLFRYTELKKETNVSAKQIEEWCRENLKNGEFAVGNSAIYIESELDGVAFKLRWL